MRLLGACVFARALALLAVFCCLTGFESVAQSLTVQPKLSVDGHMTVRFTGRSDSYYILYRGGTVAAITSPTALKLGAAGAVELTDPASATGRASAFYRVGEIPLSAPIDTDGDGIDDVYELKHASFLSALDPSDAVLDFDQDGRSNLKEYQDGTDPAVADPPQSVGLTEISPRNGESGVSVTRETFVRFSEPLAATTLIGVGDFFAEFGGRRILSRIELSSDRQTATLFYLENLPGGARVHVTFRGDKLKDVLGRAVDADGDGQPGGTLTIDFDTVSIAAISRTAVSGLVYRSDLAPGNLNTTNVIERPLQGVNIEVVGAEETLRTTTDSAGRFTLNPSPAGRFFVRIDGRPCTSFLTGDTTLPWAQRAYYPVIEKAWEAVAGRTDNLAGAPLSTNGIIYLPLVVANTLQPVSATRDTVINFPAAVTNANPALAGVAIVVPANSLLAENGARGGRVGIAPVASDRLPEPLPPGLKHTLDISIQTDGPQNFDRPVPVRFPNLPDPVTGVKLPPGAKSALWSFNHDLGRWEVAGPMTVTGNGNFVDSDAGFGVKRPGWHGTMPGTTVIGQLTFGLDGFSPCNSPSHRRLLSPVLSPELLQSISSQGRQIQNIDDGFGPYVYDNYTVTVTMPTGLTPEEFLSRMAMDLNGTVNDAIFTLINKFSTDPNPTAGDIYKIDILGPNDGNVVLVEKTADHFSFCTLTDPSAPVFKQHPENGCREFGFTRNANSTVTFYTRGASRPHSVLIEFGTPIQAGSWSSLTRGVGNSIKQLGGQVVPDSDRLDVHFNPEKSDCQNAPPITPRKKARPAGIAPEKADGFDAKFVIEYADYDSGDTTIKTLRGKTTSAGKIDVILPPRVAYRLVAYEAQTGLYGFAQGKTESSGLTTDLGQIFVNFDALKSVTDSDGDGLPDLEEFVLGTDPNNPDSDGDGIPDGVEVRQGTNPLDGRPAVTGVIGTAATDGSAVDIATLNDLAVIANSSGSVTVFNVAGINPIRVSQVPTPGPARRIAFAGNFAAVACDTAGLVILDLTDPSAAKISNTVFLGSPVKAVAIAGGIAYAGCANGQIAAVDLASGSVVETLSTGRDPVLDFALAGDYLYALTASSLLAVPLDGQGLRVVGSAPASGGIRITAGSGLAYVTYSNGVTLFSLAKPGVPVFLLQNNTAQRGWQQLVPNGSGLGVACTGVNGPDDVSLYSLGAAGKGLVFQTTFVTPGIANALSLYNGLAYVADGAAGLDVINYLAYDNKKQPPTIALSASFPLNPAQSEEGKLVRLTAEVTDDVQVRNVEFYVDGARVATDGNFPFEHRFVTPTRSATKKTFTVRAKATDTGGNFTWTDEVLVTLVPDATPPHVLRTVPADGAITGSTHVISAYLNEPFTGASGATFRLKTAGPDGIPGNADDVLVASGLVEYRSDINAVFQTYAADLAPGLYVGEILPPLADLAGNPVQPFSWRFWIIGGKDSDHDGIPDDIELAMGLDPNNPDTNGNGVLDGDEDFDGDGLSNRWEILYGYDPRKRDTDGNGVNDGDEDPDFDGLSNLREFQLGTNPFKADTDGDGWDDATEVAEGTNPLSPNSGARVLISSGDVAYLNALTEPVPASTPAVLASAQVSFLNGLTEQPPSGVLQLVVTPAVSYLNAVTDMPPTGVSYTLTSATVSYLNAAPEPGPALWQFYTPVIYYVNQAPIHP